MSVLQIPSHPRYHVDDSGVVYGLSGKPLTQYRRSGYPSVWLSNPVRQITVHTLVLEAFVGPRPQGQQARHLNDNPDDNRLENLKWGTPSENAYDRVRNGKDAHTRATHCAKGHEFSLQNTAIYLDKNGRRARRCRQCNRDNARRQRGH